MLYIRVPEGTHYLHPFFLWDGKSSVMYKDARKAWKRAKLGQATVDVVGLWCGFFGCYFEFGLPSFCVCLVLCLFVYLIHSSRSQNQKSNEILNFGAQQQGAFWLWSFRVCTMTANLQSSWQPKGIRLLYNCISTATSLLCHFMPAASCLSCFECTCSEQDLSKFLDCLSFQQIKKWWCLISTAQVAQFCSL